METLLKPKIDFNHKIGSIIRNPQSDRRYGVLIKRIGDTLFFARLHDDELLPIFNKINMVPNLEKVSSLNDNCDNIDSYNYKLKNGLLKYYRTRNLDEKEKNF